MEGHEQEEVEEAASSPELISGYFFDLYLYPSKESTYKQTHKNSFKDKRGIFIVELSYLCLFYT